MWWILCRIRSKSKVQLFINVKKKKIIVKNINNDKERLRRRRTVQIFGKKAYCNMLKKNIDQSFDGFPIIFPNLYLASCVSLFWYFPTNISYFILYISLKPVQIKFIFFRERMNRCFFLLLIVTSFQQISLNFLRFFRRYEDFLLQY